MLQTGPAARIHHYHNLYLNLSDPGATNQFVWYDFSNGTGDRIRNFLNNIVIYPGAFTAGSGPNPAVIQANAVVGPSAGAVSTLTANGGVFAGTSESDMGLNADLSLPATSPAAGIGVPLPNGFPDSQASNNDAGPFPVGFQVGENWPRETVTTFDLTPPGAFAS
jgi:hypothetical protein